MAESAVGAIFFLFFQVAFLLPPLVAPQVAPDWRFQGIRPVLLADSMARRLLSRHKQVDGNSMKVDESR